MDDTISRQVVLDAIEKAMCEDGFRSATGLIHKTTAYDIIRHLPSAQQWIPVTERMPDPDVWVLVSCDEDVTIMAVTEYGEWYFTDGDFTHEKIDAWMPLPDPWRAES